MRAEPKLCSPGQQNYSGKSGTLFKSIQVRCQSNFAPRFLIAEPQLLIQLGRPKEPFIGAGTRFNTTAVAELVCRRAVELVAGTAGNRVVGNSAQWIAPGSRAGVANSLGDPPENMLKINPYFGNTSAAAVEKDANEILKTDPLPSVLSA